ncbi:creatininase family protein [Halogeometricum luteum]|uniref:Creatininase family protein n=1 Tax=Halogeometricum luteum TaxID=2950537 RepID=A0ABU2FZX8_9EURY|nr:creatininase family protein [Halogeometricum sp. S3BR5-2]MDS0293544.1 creatininase family protein [Halogeometricum sp. S3BR5-2]
MERSPHLQEHTTTTAAERFEDASVAVLPTGAIEQHGPALPLGTDYLAARAVAQSVDREDAILLPPIPVGVSDHHRQFDGTLAVSPETFAAYVEETVESLAAHGLRKVVVANGHGGNDDALERAARRLRSEETAFVVPWNWWSNLDGTAEELFGTEGIGHADEMETSMVYAAAPELVREDALAAAEEEGADSWGTTVAGASLPVDAAEFTDSGAVGRPTRASAEAGERLLTEAQEDLETLIDWLSERSFESLLPAEHR